MFGKYYLLPPRAAPPPPLLREGEKLLPLERDGLLTAGVEDEREGMVAVCRYEERVMDGRYRAARRSNGYCGFFRIRFRGYVCLYRIP